MAIEYSESLRVRVSVEDRLFLESLGREYGSVSEAARQVFAQAREWQRINQRLKAMEGKRDEYK